MALISKDKRKWVSVPNKYGITEKDMIGELEGFSVGIAIKMLEEQEKQGNKPDITIFQKNNGAAIMYGGFSWANSEDEFDFWNHIINGKKYDEFYKKYPEYKKI